ncbi:hypothetical protein [Flavobacterium pallidum]|uniref:Phage abortive infection protein n=1 Tax=Flavobacterium pallidum TaxID=2172098 RepID=A0A2S1SKC1_9FLAO|nr:hypothetical protein [Flavobacterium pallidum]AWI26812.1 hypothetical protein HYN49_13395 [Flavobacterium pallidum]
MTDNQFNHKDRNIFTKNAVKIALIISVFSLAILFATAILFTYNFGGLTFKVDDKIFDSFGSFVGGILGPLLSLVATLLFYRAMIMQKEELTLQRNSIDMQRKEAERQTQEMAETRKQFETTRLTDILYKQVERFYSNIDNLEYEHNALILTGEKAHNYIVIGFSQISLQARNKTVTKESAERILEYFGTFGLSLWIYSINAFTICQTFYSVVENSKLSPDEKNEIMSLFYLSIGTVKTTLFNRVEETVNGLEAAEIDLSKTLAHSTKDICHDIIELRARRYE